MIDFVVYKIMGPADWSDPIVALASFGTVTIDPEAAFLDLCKRETDDTALVRAMLNLSEPTTGAPIFQIGPHDPKAVRTYEVRIFHAQGKPRRVEVRLSFDIEPQD